MKKSRIYRMKRRAESQAATRQRIVEAAVKLHEERGVKATTISDIAERAGVERLTVYRHFPDELSLVRACSGHWSERHPLPDSAAWNTLDDAAAKAQMALRAVYSYYRGSERMLKSVSREESEVAAVRAGLKDLHSYMRSTAADLLAAWHPGGRPSKALQGAIAHSLEFSTWLSLKSQHLRDSEIADLMTLWFHAIQPPSSYVKSRKN